MSITFDPSEYEVEPAYKEIPDGEHEFIVIDHKFKTWDDGGATLSIRLGCLTEGFENKFEFAKFRIVSNDKDKEKKARGYLVQFHKACGVEKVADYEDPSEVSEKKLIGTIQTFNGKKTFVPWGWEPCGSPLESKGHIVGSSKPSASKSGEPYEDDVPF